MASCSRAPDTGQPDERQLDPIRTIRAVLVEVTNDDALTTGSDGTKLCLAYAETLSKQLSSPTVKDKVFVEWLIKDLKNVTKSKDRTELWKKFYVLRSSKQFCEKWREYLELLNLPNEPLFYQHITLALFDRLLSDKFKDDARPSETSPVEFTFEEENAIRYMGGYVIRKLREKKIWMLVFLRTLTRSISIPIPLTGLMP